MLNLIKNYSPNFSTYKRNFKNIKFIIIHYTGMMSENKAINRLTNVNSKVSCHYFVKKNGKIILMVPEIYTSWHAGKSKWKKFKSLNKYSIGIEIQNSGHANNLENFTTKQIISLIRICKYLKKKYKIKKENILGHSDISYDRKKDPGEKFPWKVLAKHKLSIWHNIEKKNLIHKRNIKLSKTETKSFFKSLKKFGYPIQKNSIKDKKLIICFQRRFRQELINGIVDKECLIIANKLINI